MGTIVLNMLLDVGRIMKCKCRLFIKLIEQICFFSVNHRAENYRLIVEVNEIKFILTIKNSAELFFFPKAMLVGMLTRWIWRGFNTLDSITCNRRAACAKYRYRVISLCESVRKHIDDKLDTSVFFRRHKNHDRRDNGNLHW